MKKLVSATVFILMQIGVFAQDYTVSIAPFSTLSNNEYSPVFYKNGIVFCSDLKNNSLITYKNNQRKLFNIFYVPSAAKSRKKEPKLFSPELTTNFNDGPITFSLTGDTAFFCRNFVTGNSLQIGIFSATFKDNSWENIQPFKYNSSQYSNVTPALSTNGKRLYFASDMPGGFGGADLYYCEWKNNNWESPVNLGAAINTSGNESFPFITQDNRLFFASDQHQGMGGKDLFYTTEINGNWTEPVHLDTLINSPFDDFGLVCDQEFREGYFSSNRRKNDDIYKFSVKPVMFTCDSMVKDNYCFLFYDEYQVLNDTIPVKYIWEFGNGIKQEGMKVQYCFPGPGSYKVKLVICDRNSPEKILNETPYEFELPETRQVFINSPDAVIAGTKVQLSGIQNIPDFKTEEYIWDFGEGFKVRGPAVTRNFDKTGEFTIRLGLRGKNTERKSIEACSFKKIKVFTDYQEMAVQTSQDIYNYKRSLEDSTNESDSEGSSEFTVKTYLLNFSPEEKTDILKNLDLSKKVNIIVENSSSITWYNDLIYLLKHQPDLKLMVAVHSYNGANDQDYTNQVAKSLLRTILQNGLDEQRIQCVGYGSSRPVKSNDTQKRMEFIIYKE